MTNKIIGKFKDNIIAMFERNAEKEHAPDSFWANTKKRNTTILVIIGLAIIVAAAYKPEVKKSQLPKESVKNEFDFALNDITESEKNDRPTAIFSEQGSEQLDAISSQQLLNAMEEEVKVKEEQLEDQRKELSDKEEILEKEIDAVRLESRTQLQALESEMQKQLIDKDIENTSKMQMAISAIINGEDPSSIDPSLKLTEDQKRILEQQQGYTANRTSPQTYQGTKIINGNSTSNNTGMQRNTGSVNIRGGIRVMNETGSYRVATGQTVDLNNIQSVQNLASQQQTGNKIQVPKNVFEELALAKQKLREKRDLMRQVEAEKQEVIQDTIEKKRNTVSLTAGSIISGTLINGMYVPTGSSTTSEPIPALFRVKREALMPNYFVSEEVVECVIIAASKPAIESIRVNFRATAITCIRDDGTAIEDSLKAISTGPDGTTGVPATLVSRNSEMLQRTAVAGFLTGLTDILSQTSLEVNPDESGVYAISGSGLASLTGSAALGGAGDALSRLSNYYMDLADKMQPTLKVGAGINVDFLVTSLSILDFSAPKNR